MTSFRPAKNIPNIAPGARHERPAPVRVPGTAGTTHDSSSSSWTGSDPRSFSDPSSDNTSIQSFGQVRCWEKTPEVPYRVDPATVWGREHEISIKRARNDSPVYKTTSQSSYMRTPLSDLYSPPFYWNLPQSNVQLTFGVELEHVFAYSMVPREGYEFMFNEDEDNLLNKYWNETHNGVWAERVDEGSANRERIHAASKDVHQRILKHKGLGCSQQHKPTDCSGWTLTDVCFADHVCADTATDSYLGRVRWHRIRHEKVAKLASRKNQGERGNRVDNELSRTGISSPGCSPRIFFIPWIQVGRRLAGDREVHHCHGRTAVGSLGSFHQSHMWSTRACSTQA